MKILTCDTSNLEINWLVAKCEVMRINASSLNKEMVLLIVHPVPDMSDRMLCETIIKREKIDVMWDAPGY